MKESRVAWMERASLEQFEAELARRTRPPPGADRRFEKLSDQQLRAGTREISRTVKRFATAVADAMDADVSAGQFLDSLDLVAISRDHDWRFVFAALRGDDGGREQHRRVALGKYLQFLYSRRDLLERVLSEREAFEETGTGEDPTVPSATVLARLRQLTPGETIAVRLPEIGSLPMRLGRHAFRLSAGTPPKLFDDKGHEYVLPQGRSKVGRHPESDIRLDRDLGDVSRLHMVVEWRGDEVLHVTDLSSRGTFVDALGLADPA